MPSTTVSSAHPGDMKTLSELSLRRARSPPSPHPAWDDPCLLRAQVVALASHSRAQGRGTEAGDSHAQECCLLMSYGKNIILKQA